MRMGGAMAVVQVVDIGACVPVSNDAAVGEHVHMLIGDSAVVVRVRRMVVAVSMTVNRAVGMHVLMFVRGRIGPAFDPRFPATASTGRAHRCLRKRRHATSIAFTFISSPCVTCS
jgi:hypothetical protein